MLPVDGGGPDVDGRIQTGNWYKKQRVKPRLEGHVQNAEAGERLLVAELVRVQGGFDSTPNDGDCFASTAALVEVLHSMLAKGDPLGERAAWVRSLLGPSAGQADAARMRSRMSDLIHSPSEDVLQVLMSGLGEYALALDSSAKLCGSETVEAFARSISITVGDNQAASGGITKVAAKLLCSMLADRFREHGKGNGKRVRARPERVGLDFSPWSPLLNYAPLSQMPCGAAT